ncbi:MAG TPA: DUF952 domain-containing protein [Rhizomicrobium sp.]|jgi:uncharacterized protein (DUF952 family)
MLVYKICHRADWELPENIPAYHGSVKDREDGFLHFSTAEQLPGTLARYYADADDLMLVAVDANSLGPELKFEPSREGLLFPHLYRELNYDAVKWARPIKRDASGAFVLPLQNE